MYFISTIISRISYGIFRFGNVIFGPFRSIGYGLRSLTRFNPLRVIRSSFYGIESQVRYIFHLPDPAKSARRASLSADVPREQRSGRWRTRKRDRVSQRAQYSQIHLIDQTTEERTVVHIGTIIGRSTAEIVLNHPAHRPVQLRFSQVDPQAHQAPMVLTYVAGEAAVQVNSVDIEHDAPLPDNAVIQVDDHVYACQLYAWDKAPIVTRVDAGWATDVGPKREENEDALGLYQYSDAYLFAVADGVGKGEYGGQVSEFAIRYLLAVFHQNVKYHLNWHDILEKAYKYINAEVRHFARHSPTSEGTTLTSVVIRGMEAHVAHVGDSRLYHWHEGTLRQMTTDHVGQMPVEQETRVANESAEPPQMKLVLTKAIGKSDAIQPDIFTIPLQPGDRLLLCSDGVAGVIPGEELVQIFSTMRAGRLAGHLIQLAVERESSDNVSAIAIDVLKDAYVEDAWVAENEDRIYAGFSPSWPLHMSRPRDLYTSYPIESRSGCWVALGVLMVIVILFFALRSGGNDSAAASGADTLSPSPSPTASMTVVPTETPRVPPTATRPTATSTPTELPTATRIRPTPTIMPTPIPPTSTLRVSAFTGLGERF